MTRRSLRIAFLACAGFITSAGIGSPAAAQQAITAKEKVKAAAAAAQVADSTPKVTAVSKYSLPANATERATLSAQLAQGNCIQPAYAMAMSRMLDDRPLERPKSLTILKGDRLTALDRVRAVLKTNGFSVVSSDADSGEVLVSRVDGGYQGARDDLLIWADGQAGDANRIRIYLQYGRFEPFFGSTTAQRVATSTEEVQKRIGAVRQALVDLGAT